MCWMSKNGVLFTGDPVAGTGGYDISSIAATSFFLVCSTNGGQITLNAGSSPFNTNPPTGYTAWG